MENQQIHVQETPKETFFEKLFNLKWGGIYTEFNWAIISGKNSFNYPVYVEKVRVRVIPKEPDAEKVVPPQFSLKIPGTLHLKYLVLEIYGSPSSQTFKEILGAIEATKPVYANGEWREMEAAALVKFDGHPRAQ